jgi:iron complex transport system substrate-binding protein
LLDIIKNFEEKKMKKWSVLLMVIVLFSMTLMGCQAPKEEVAKNTTNIVTDMLGREVELPSEINTIATPNVDAFRIMLQLGAEDKLIGVPSNMYDSKYSDVDTIEVQAWPEVKDLTQVGGGPPNTEINVESLIKLNPDIIISWSYSSTDAGIEQAELLQEKTMIPVICLNSIAKTGKSTENIDGAYTLLGEITGEEEKATELLDYYYSEMEALTSVIEENNPEPARFYMSGPSTLLKATNSYLPLKQLDLDNVAIELGDKGGEITKEQLIAWNPSLIYMHTPSQVYGVKAEELQDPILASVDAIENDQTYHLKGTYMGWDIATGLIDSNIIAKTAYPSLFEDIDMEEKGDDILNTFYRTEGLYPSVKESSNLPSFDE